MSLRAVIFVPPSVESGKWLPRCLVHCHRQDYRVAAIVQSEWGWQSAFEMLAGGQADVVVVGRLDHLPPDRLPRIEEAVDWGSPGGRRPRTIR